MGIKQDFICTDLPSQAAHTLPKATAHKQDGDTPTPDAYQCHAGQAKGTKEASQQNGCAQPVPKRVSQGVAAHH